MGQSSCTKCYAHLYEVFAVHIPDLPKKYRISAWDHHSLPIVQQFMLRAVLLLLPVIPCFVTYSVVMHRTLSISDFPAASPEYANGYCLITFFTACQVPHSSVR